MSRTALTQDGTALSVHETGLGRLIVFQHGLCGDADQPRQVFPEGAGFRCLTVECRGHGASQVGPVEALSIATFTEDLAGIVPEPAVVGGISMGAAIALRLAVIRPDLVRALVLARPAWVTGPAPGNMAPNAEVGALLRALDPEAALARFDASATADALARSAPDNLASLRGFFGRRPAQTTAELLCRISADGPSVAEADLARLDVPCLVIGHGRDAIHPLDHARRLAALIPMADFVEITPKVVDPQAYRTDFRAALSHFLKGL